LTQLDFCYDVILLGRRPGHNFAKKDYAETWLDGLFLKQIRIKLTESDLWIFDLTSLFFCHVQCRNFIV